jgi:hypothetical protein
MRPYLLGCYLSREEREKAKQITQVAHTGDAGAHVARGTRLGVMIPEGWQGGGASVRAATKRRQTGQRGAVRIVLAELDCSSEA